ncbi:MAG: MGMT family protein [Sphingobacteriales bacterium]|nr:MGMT family protein [Sphingobacteriales bacterium]
MKADAHFFEQVYDICRLIPKGRVTSYGAVARCLGASARMVGFAMNHSHTASLPVPAHRVVNSKGVLSGKHHFGEPQRMQQLLEAEGITVINDQVEHFDQLFWNPLTEINI